MTENMTTGTPPETPQGPPDPGPRPGPNTENLRDYRRLRRSRDDRKVAGVAGGLGRHLDIDPTILRVLFVVLALFGGSGLLLYGALWLFVPEEGTEDVVVTTNESTRNTLLIVVAVLAVLLLVGDSVNGFGFPWPFAIVGLIVAVVLLARDTGGPRPPAPPYGPPTVAGHPATGQGYAPPPPPPGSHATQVLPGPAGPVPQMASGQAQPPWYPPVPPVPPRPPRNGPLLFGMTLALLALALGALGLYDVSGYLVTDSAYPALALAVIGVMLVVGAFWGRAGGLIALGLLAALVLAVTSVGNPSFEGDRDLRVRPTSSADLESDYSVPAGRIEIDLTGIRDLEELDGRNLQVDANAGELVLVVPDGLEVSYGAEIEYGGSIETPDGIREGWGSELNGVVRDDDAEAAISVDMDLQFGRIEVTQR